MFADDTALFIAVDNPTTASDILNNDLLKISNWADKWIVTFNPNKTESVLFTRKNIAVHHPRVMMNNQLISEVESHKHLGMYLTKDLSWTPHIEHIKQKAWSRINVMKKMRYRLDRASLETIYFSFIRPILEYGDILFDNCSGSEKYELDKIQHEAARIVTGASKLASIESISIETCWESLSSRRRKHKLTFFYKMLNGLHPNYLCELIPERIGNGSDYNLRNAEDIQGIRSRSNTYYYSFLPSVIREWNSLQNVLKNANSLSEFKNLLNADRTFVPAYYYYGNRQQVYHAGLRTNSGPL